MPERQLARIDRVCQKLTVHYPLPGHLAVIDPSFSAQCAARPLITPVL